MAERIAESGELAVDELKRKARRRLVGAIVLALCAAVLVPMLLEDEPRSLGDDVSVQIPSREDGKFVSRLTGAAPDAKSRSKAAPAPEPKAAQPEQPATATEQKSPPPEREAKAPPTGGGGGQATGTPPDAAPAAPKVQAPAPSTATPPPAAPAAQTAPAQATAPQTAPTQASGGFSVQLAAFSDDKGAKALANKLKRAEYPAYVEPVTTSRGTLWRVRVGGYATRSEADATRAKLKDEGYSGIVTAAK